MIGLLLLAALLAALGATGLRRLRRLRRQRAMSALPGGSRATAFEVDAFSGIDEHLEHRECRCGGLLSSHGERSENTGGRMLRVVRVECRRCEERGEVWFDVTRAYH